MRASEITMKYAALKNTIAPLPENADIFKEVRSALASPPLVVFWDCQ